MRLHKLVFLVAALICSCNTQKPEPPSPPSPPTPTKPVEKTEGPLKWEESWDCVKNMGLGWNLGNTLESVSYTDTHSGSDVKYWETYWGQPQASAALMQMFKNAGFGAIRVPVTWGIHLRTDGSIDPAWLNRVEAVVQYVLNTGMYCILNVHHDTGADKDAWLVASMKEYELQKSKYESIWRQIAERFKEYDHKLLFEGYNEMLDEGRSWCFPTFNKGYNAAMAVDSYKAINCYAQSFVNVVRSTGGKNAERNLIVNTYAASCGVGDWNDHLREPLTEMILPEDKYKNHLIFQVHSYPNIDDIVLARIEVEDLCAVLYKNLLSKGAPVIIGEWGHSSEFPIKENRLEFIRYFVTKVKSYGYGLFHWMGLSDGVARSIPAFSEGECTMAMLNAYHGDNHNVDLPTLETADYSFKIDFRSLWSEASLCSQNLNTKEYSAIRLQLDSKPGEGELCVKFYGDSEGKTDYAKVSSSDAQYIINETALGAKITRITLQLHKGDKYSCVIKRVILIRKDGSEEILCPSSFWGVDVSLLHP